MQTVETTMSSPNSTNAVLADSKINLLIAKCGTKAKVIEILQRCTTADGIDKMTDDELVELWFHRWVLG
jgi:hypothetical protein